MIWHGPAYRHLRSCGQRKLPVWIPRASIDALAGFVQSGVVDVKDAYRKAFDREAFLAVLRREGIDTSFVERRA